MKKSILFIALAAAIVIGCTTEMLDTSYENILKEAQLKGENPVVFGAYAGNEYGQTRANFTTSQTQLFNGSFSNGDEIGVFAYYTGSMDLNTDFSSSWPKTRDIDSWGETGWFASRNRNYSPQYFMPNFMYNQNLVYNSSSNWTYSPTKYWPQEGKVSFFAYYPYQNTSNWSSSKRLNIIRKDYNGTPFLEYYVLSADVHSDLDPIDLMAAEPVLNKQFDKTYDWNSSNNTVEFKMKHLLAAMSVKLLVKSNGSWDNNLRIHINNAVLRGNGSSSSFSNSPTPNEQFKKGGRYDLAHGCWYTGEYEPLNLMGNVPFLLDGFQSSYNARLYKLYSPNFDSSNFDSSNYTSSTNYFESSFSESWKKDGYLTIIPLENRVDNRYLALILDYNISVRDGALLQGQFVENKHIEKVIEIPGGIQPGKYYQILLELDLNAVNIKATVESGNWELGDNQNVNFMGS